MSEDWLEDNPLGFSISAVGGQMVITTTGYNEWYPPIGQVSGPIAYYTAPLAPPVNGPVRFVGKLEITGDLGDDLAYGSGFGETSS